MRTVTFVCIVCLALFNCGRSATTSEGTLASAGDSPSPPIPPPLKQAEPPLPTNLSKMLASGTNIPVQFTYILDSSETVAGQYMYSVVDEDVKGSDGRLAIPAGSTVTLVVRESGRRGAVSRVRVGLLSAYIAGKAYNLSKGDIDVAALDFTEDAGQGPGHASVHIERGTRLAFKLTSAVPLQ